MSVAFDALLQSRQGQTLKSPQTPFPAVSRSIRQGAAWHLPYWQALKELELAAFAEPCCGVGRTTERRVLFLRL